MSAQHICHDEGHPIFLVLRRRTDDGKSCILVKRNRCRSVALFIEMEAKLSISNATFIDISFQVSDPILTLNSGIGLFCLIFFRRADSVHLKKQGLFNTSGTTVQQTVDCIFDLDSRQNVNWVFLSNAAFRSVRKPLAATWSFEAAAVSL